MGDHLLFFVYNQNSLQAGLFFVISWKALTLSNPYCLLRLMFRDPFLVSMLISSLFPDKQAALCSNKGGVM